MINMNQRETLSRESIASLLASKDDSLDRQVRVMENGDVVLSDVVGSQGLDGVRFRLETLSAGNDYVGEAAAKDANWVNRIYHAVFENWDSNARGYIDDF